MCGVQICPAAGDRSPSLLYKYLCMYSVFTCIFFPFGTRSKFTFLPSDERVCLPRIFSRGRGEMMNEREFVYLRKKVSVCGTFSAAITWLVCAFHFTGIDGKEAHFPPMSSHPSLYLDSGYVFDLVRFGFSFFSAMKRRGFKIFPYIFFENITKHMSMSI